MDVPLERLTKSGFTRPAASTNAVSIFETAVVNWPGVGGVKSAARSSPVTCVEVANVPIFVSAKPVRKLDADGLTPTFPSRDKIPAFCHPRDT